MRGLDQPRIRLTKLIELKQLGRCCRSCLQPFQPWWGIRLDRTSYQFLWIDIIGSGYSLNKFGAPAVLFMLRKGLLSIEEIFIYQSIPFFWELGQIWQGHGGALLRTWSRGCHEIVLLSGFRSEL